MTASRQQLEQTLEAYLDGLLEGPDREAFERRIEEQPDLQAAVRQHRAIDSALKRVIGPPPQVRLNPAPDTAAPARPPAGAGWRLVAKRLAVAAALAGGVFGAWQIYSVLRPDSGGYQPMAWRTLEAVYRDEVESGFEPGWVCENDEEFADSFRRSLRQRLLHHPLGTQAHPHWGVGPLLLGAGTSHLGAVAGTELPAGHRREEVILALVAVDDFGDKLLDLDSESELFSGFAGTSLAERFPSLNLPTGEQVVRAAG